MAGAFESSMPALDTSRTNILAAIDYSEGSTSVVDEAVAISQRHRPSNLHFLHVNQSTIKDEEGQEGRRFELLDWLKARLPAPEDALAGITVIAHEAIGDPWHLIVQMASDLRSDVVVLGTSDRKGMERMMMGSVAEAVSRHCGCSVFVVRRKVHDHRLMDIEAVCGLCVEARLASQGNVLWCNDHVLRQGRRHAYYGKGIAQWAHRSFGA
jgi:nucleotide-binding universal stress UspA family protein